VGRDGFRVAKCDRKKLPGILQSMWVARFLLPENEGKQISVTDDVGKVLIPELCRGYSDLLRRNLRRLSTNNLSVPQKSSPLLTRGVLNNTPYKIYRVRVHILVPSNDTWS
jgi:hypothetical protein